MKELPVIHYGLLNHSINRFTDLSEPARDLLKYDIILQSPRISPGIKERIQKKRHDFMKSADIYTLMEASMFTIYLSDIVLPSVHPPLTKPQVL